MKHLLIYKKYTFLFFIYFFNLFYPAYANENDHIISVKDCIRSIGKYLYVEKKLSNFIINCDISDNSEYRNIEILDFLKKHRHSLQKYFSIERMRCLQSWNKELNSGIEQVNTKNFNEISSLAFLEKAIITRSVIEKVITDEAMNSGRFYESEKKGCYNVNRLIAIFRSINALYIYNNNILDLYKENRLDHAIYRPLWFIIQHADLQLWFQEKWLKVLEESQDKTAFPKKLVKSLRERVDLAHERKKD